ncbi:MobF family relaxase [Mariprofundus ferrooxydans]|uniref:MobF family relaxase n=1 Tax=Mariprofundus ferrooxydans TaxID=314344 RepID=UPI0014316E61|nr:MobF family relaxase [Mariprofundus ferrooxydans]
MTASISAISNAGYYEDLAKEDYYEGGGEPPGEWQGSGAESLGLTGTLADGELKMMLEGYHPTSGKALASNAGEGHRPGHDITFSAPKSVSAVWAAAGDPALRTQIQQAQAQAVQKAVEYIEKNVANIRRGHGGVEHEQARVIAASYEHSTSRAQDPQLHTHTLVASHGIGVETGAVRSLESRQFYQHQKAIGAVYRAELAAGMQKIGFNVQRDGQSFKISGSDAALEKTWSKRRADIEQQLEERGTKGARASEKAALNSRETKQAVDRSQLFEKWGQEAQEHGFSVEDIRTDSIEKTDFSMRDLLQAATENQSVFTEAKLHELVAQELQGNGGLEDMRYRIDELKRGGELVELGKSDGMTQYTTQEMLRLEQSIVDFARDGQARDDWHISEQHIEQAIEAKAGISTEQRAALRHIAGPGQVVAVEGAAGTGKSFMLEGAKMAFESAGHKVTGCSLSGKAAAELQAGSGIQSQTIHSLLNELDRGQKTLSGKDILVMDEAGMTDTRLMARVTDHVSQAGAKLVLVGDTQQLQSIGAGGTFGKIAHDVGSAEILEVRRQKVEWQKQAAMDIRGGRAVDALKAFQDHDRLHIHDKTVDTHKDMVSQYLSSPSPASEKLMIAGRRADVAALNREARTQLKASGQLRGAVPVSLHDNDAGQTRSLEIAQGDRLKLTKNSKELGVKNGDLATVKGIEFTEKGLRINIETDAGKQVQIDPSSYPHMMHGYAITAHASQGATVDQAHFYASSFNSKELSYVSASRHRLDAHIYGSKEELGSEPVDRLKDSFARTDEKKTALEMAEKHAEQVEKARSHADELRPENQAEAAKVGIEPASIEPAEVEMELEMELAMEM